MTTNHDRQLLGAYVLGVLDEREVRAVEDHLASCPRCRAELAELRTMEAAMGDVPPEALLDGPPEGGDLLVQRALRQVRSERGGQLRRRQVGLGLVAAAVAAVVIAATKCRSTPSRYVSTVSSSRRYARPRDEAISYVMPTDPWKSGHDSP